MGHRRIAYIHGEESAETKAAFPRFTGHAKSLGLKFRRNMCGGRHRDTTKTYLATEALLKCRICPTCILFPDDFAYIGERYLNATLGGEKSDEDISTIGDGIEIGGIWNLRLQR